MFLGVAIPAIVVGIIAWFYLKDKPPRRQVADHRGAGLAHRGARRREGHDGAEAVTATGSAQARASRAVASGCSRSSTSASSTASTPSASSCPTIIGGFQEQFGTEFDVIQKGLITAIPYVPAAIALYFWSRDATRRGLKTWHIVIPALVGALSIPLALFAELARPHHRRHRGHRHGDLRRAAQLLDAAHAVPHRCRSGGGHRAHQHGRQPRRLLAPRTSRAAVARPAKAGDYRASPMFIVGFFMLLSAVLMVRRSPAPSASRRHLLPSEPAGDRRDRTDLPRTGRSPMTRLFNDPGRLRRRDDRRLRRREPATGSAGSPAASSGSTLARPGTVALVIGGGSGHYPAFGGLVGQGLAHGAAMGNLFASPSCPAGQVGREVGAARRRRPAQLRQLRRRRAQLRRRRRTR